MSVISKLKGNIFVQRSFKILKCIIRKLLVVIIHIVPGGRRNVPYSIEQSTEILNQIKQYEEKNIDQTLLRSSPCDVAISIIIPVYNCEKYLEECLNSINNQKTTFTYEVIIINDGSTDRSAEIINKYNDDHFIIVSEPNSGQAVARNLGLSLARGSYITFIDADDFVSDNYIESMIKKAQSTDADIVLSCYSNCNYSSNINNTCYFGDHVYTNFYGYLGKSGVPWGKIYKRKLWENVSYPDNIAFEDTIILNVIYRRCLKLVTNDNCIYYYRIHDTNTIKQILGTPKAIDSIWSVKYSLNLCNKLGITPTIDYYYALLLQTSIHVYYRLRGYDRKTKMAAFICLRDLVISYRNSINMSLPRFPNIILEKLDMAFVNGNYTLWKLCSLCYQSHNYTLKVRSEE
ncbi:Glycosyl transferase family 2 [Butyrivibrio fibrisolvens]|uniref:Glycosyl transferase family 2 n=1 Tax=Butyrivibrio fibrisolvens TaxID=831 RepID=A0A1H9X272_BUTFI|nr:glycosyltransferase family 2 protein [Butyrivibrio fibrisolvens]SES40189.1 Glycosyl transferase family 2 [Butyrivibrio fibrisolvens]